MKNKYYEIVGTIEGRQDVLYGSFVKADCVYEKDAELHNWKEDGYKAIKIVSRYIDEAPDKEVYSEELVTKEELFLQQAPSFNFELDATELLEKAIEVGFVTKVHGVENQYLINKDNQDDLYF